MTLREISAQYRSQEMALKQRIAKLETEKAGENNPREYAKLLHRLGYLYEMRREARDIAVLLERYYERGYRRNGRYTL